jgi:hypothetical protein
VAINEVKRMRKFEMPEVQGADDMRHAQPEASWIDFVIWIGEDLSERQGREASFL